MKRVTYLGPSDRLRIDGRYAYRGVPTELPNDLADKAKQRCGDRLTVHDPEPATGGQEDDDQ